MVDHEELMDKFDEPVIITETLAIGRRLTDLVPALEVKKRQVIIIKIGLFSGKSSLIDITRIRSKKGSSYLTKRSTMEFGTEGHLRFKLKNINEFFFEYKQLLKLLVKNELNPDDVWIREMTIYDTGTKHRAIFKLDEPKTVTEKQMVHGDSTRLKMQLELKRIKGEGVNLSYDEKEMTEHPTHYTKSLLISLIPNIHELTTCIPNSPVFDKICKFKYPPKFKPKKVECELPATQVVDTDEEELIISTNEEE